MLNKKIEAFIILLSGHLLFGSQVSDQGFVSYVIKDQQVAGKCKYLDPDVLQEYINLINYKKNKEFKELADTVNAINLSRLVGPKTQISLIEIQSEPPLLPLSEPSSLLSYTENLTQSHPLLPLPSYEESVRDNPIVAAEYLRYNKRIVIKRR